MWSCWGARSAFAQRRQPAAGCAPCPTAGCTGAGSFGTGPARAPHWLGTRQPLLLLENSTTALPAVLAGGRRHALSVARSPGTAQALHCPAQPQLPTTVTSQGSSRARRPACLVFLAVTLLLQCFTAETNTPLYNVIMVVLQSSPQRDKVQKL